MRDLDATRGPAAQRDGRAGAEAAAAPRPNGPPTSRTAWARCSIGWARWRSSSPTPSPTWSAPPGRWGPRPSPCGAPATSSRSSCARARRVRSSGCSDGWPRPCASWSDSAGARPSWWSAAANRARQERASSRSAIRCCTCCATPWPTGSSRRPSGWRAASRAQRAHRDQRPPGGRVRLHLQFEDDGRGIDREQVRQALVRSGRLAADAPLDEPTPAGRDLRARASPAARTRTRWPAGGWASTSSSRRSCAWAATSASSTAPGVTRFRLSVPLTRPSPRPCSSRWAARSTPCPAVHVVEALPIGLDDLLSHGREAAASALGPGRPGAAAPVAAGRGDAARPPRGRPAHPLRRAQLRRHLRQDHRPAHHRRAPARAADGPDASLRRRHHLGRRQGPAGAGPGRPGRRRPARPPRRTRRCAGASRACWWSTTPASSREAAARVLAAAGYHPVTAEDGWEAWEMIGERRFDAVVTDLEMPRVDGFELITRIRRDPTLRGSPSSSCPPAPRRPPASAPSAPAPTWSSPRSPTSGAWPTPWPPWSARPPTGPGPPAIC